MMRGYTDFDVSIEEIHHVEKKDSPSGTSIVLANDIIEYFAEKKTWTNEKSLYKSPELSIKSERLGNNVGTHIVTYCSPFDVIEIKHKALTRMNFALGALMCAEWLIDYNKKGFFHISDMLQI